MVLGVAFLSFLSGIELPSVMFAARIAPAIVALLQLVDIDHDVAEAGRCVAQRRRAFDGARSGSCFGRGRLD